MTEETLEVVEQPTVSAVSEPVQEAPAPEEETITPDLSVTETPVEVVSVDELVDRLISDTEEQTEQETQEPEPVEETVEPVTPSAMEIVGMDQLLENVEMIQLTVDHPALETPFEEYTVMEGLLLLLFVLVIISWCVKMIKGGFSWLLW